MVVSILGIIGWCIFGIQGIVQQRKLVKIIDVLTIELTIEFLILWF